MSTSTVEQREGNNKKVGWLTTLVMHILLLALILYPFLTIPNPPPGQEGILISFGTPDVGQGDVQPIAENPSERPSEVEDTPVEQPEEEIEEVVPEEAAPPESSEPERDVLTAEDAEAIAIQREKDRKAREKAEKEAKEEAERVAKEEAQRKAEEEARRKAEEEARKLEEAKNQFGFPGRNNNSNGQGNTNKPGDQGAPNGDPNADNLDGDNSTGKGSADIGGGLAGRGVDARPTVTNRSQKQGKVRVKICVDPSGKVTSAEYSLSGSRTQDSYLVQLAKDSAKKFKFSANAMAPESQCGHIDFNFVLN
ncbi:MAG: hypothetical protein AAFV80_05390 [Bacteroidota bacterium]